MPLTMSKWRLYTILFISILYRGVFLKIFSVVSIPFMLKNDCNVNPISTFPPCYAFQIIFTALAPRLIQSIICNVHDKIGALKQLWRLDCQKQYSQTAGRNTPKLPEGIRLDCWKEYRQTAGRKTPRPPEGIFSDCLEEYALTARRNTARVPDGIRLDYRKENSQKEYNWTDGRKAQGMPDGLQPDYQMEYR